MKNEPLTPHECKPLVLALLHAVSQGHEVAAAEIANLADDPARLRKILAG
jgi:hypothetical protein